MEQVLLIDADATRRGLMRRALERRGLDITGEAASITDVINAVASLEETPSTVLVGARVEGADSNRVARLIKRTWPKATVIWEMSPEERRRERIAARGVVPAVAG